MARLASLLGCALLVACKAGYQPVPAAAYGAPPTAAYSPPLSSVAAPDSSAPSSEVSMSSSAPASCVGLAAGEHHPTAGEAQASGPIERPITREMAAFTGLVRSAGHGVVFKDEEGTGADRLMAPALHDRLQALGALVAEQWPGVMLRVTEAWDENGEHSGRSLHYEGRAADLTTSDRDAEKLGCLAGLAVQAGFSWVSREGSHVHASVNR